MPGDTGIQLSVYPPTLQQVESSKQMSACKAACEVLTLHCTNQEGNPLVDATVMDYFTTVYLAGLPRFIPGEIMLDLDDLNKTENFDGIFSNMQFYRARYLHSESGRKDLKNKDVFAVDVSVPKYKKKYEQQRKERRLWKLEHEVLPEYEGILTLAENDRDRVVLEYVIRVIQSFSAQHNFDAVINMVNNDHDNYILQVENWVIPFDWNLVSLLYTTNDREHFQEEPLDCVQLHLPTENNPMSYRLVVAVKRSRTAFITVNRVSSAQDYVAPTVSAKRKRDDEEEDDQEVKEIRNMANKKARPEPALYRAARMIKDEKTN